MPGTERVYGPPVPTFLLITLPSLFISRQFIYFSASPIPILPPRWSNFLLAIEESLHTSAIVHGLLDVFDTVSFLIFPSLRRTTTAKTTTDKARRTGCARRQQQHEGFTPAVESYYSRGALLRRPTLSAPLFGTHAYNHAT